MTGQERRAAIIDAAVRLFAERGFRGTTTRELAAAVGVSEPVLYQHFKTKRELYTAIIESKMEESEKRGDHLAAYLETDDDRGLFTALAEFILDWYAEDPAYVRLLLSSGLESHELADLFHERHAERFFETLGNYIRRRIAQRAFREIDPLLAARLFTGMVAHHAQAALLFRRAAPAESRERIVDAMVDIFLDGIRNPEQG